MALLLSTVTPMSLTSAPMMAPRTAAAVRFPKLAMSEEANVDEQYWWHDKYRPRKPRYFNRVHTGYEWNKYVV